MTMSNWLTDGHAAGLLRPDDRGLAYGDGLFETIAVRNGQLRFADLHWQRLIAGCRALSLPLPPLDLLQADIGRVVNGAAHGTVKLLWTRGPGPRGYAPPASPRPTRWVSFVAEPPPDGSARADSMTLCVLATPASTNPRLAGLKHLNRLDCVLARIELTGRGVDEGLMLDATGQVVGGTMSNVFLARSGMLLTPNLASAGVRGVMREVVLRAARALAIEIREVPLPVAELDHAEAMFLTNARMGLRPIGQCAGRPLGSATHPVVLAVRAALLQQGVSECAPC
jgi:4-amino-4-deoxychorismate lyase